MENKSASLSVRISLALLTSALLILCFPRPGLGWMAWLALVPLLFAFLGSSTAASFFLGLLSGTIAAFGIFHWISEIPGFRSYHFVLAGLYLGLYPALWCWGTNLFRRFGVPALIAAPALWVGLDYLKGHVGFLSFPWAVLAHSQLENFALIQLASITGEYGVTFCIVLANVSLVAAIVRKSWRPILPPVIILFLLHCWGFVIMPGLPAATDHVRIAVVQPNITLEERKTAPGRKASFDRMERLTLAVANQPPRPHLIVWPETAVMNLAKNPILQERIRSLSNLLHIPIITGSSERSKQFLKTGDNNSSKVKQQTYNSAYFITENKPLARPYQKRKLVPFFEYNPLQPASWLSWLVSDVSDITAGDSYSHYPLDGGGRVSPIICWENLFADFVRQLARERPSIIVQLTNDIRFGPTAEPYQHNAASVFRAVENRTPIVISSNSGPSQIIDPYGRIVEEIPYLFAEGSVTAPVNINQGVSFYTKNGDLFAITCILLLITAVAAAITVSSRKFIHNPLYLQHLLRRKL